MFRAAESQDELQREFYELDPPHKFPTASREIPCFDPATMQKLDTLPGMSALKVPPPPAMYSPDDIWCFSLMPLAMQKASLTATVRSTLNVHGMLM